MLWFLLVVTVGIALSHAITYHFIKISTWVKFNSFSRLVENVTDLVKILVSVLTPNRWPPLASQCSLNQPSLICTVRLRWKMVKDTGEPPRQERGTGQAVWEGVWHLHALSGSPPSQPLNVFTNQDLSEPCTLGVFMEAQSHAGMRRRKLHFRPLYLLWRMEGGAESPKLLIIAWSFW